MYIQSAIDAAQALVDSKEYALFRDKGKESYKYLHILEGDDSKEVLLARRYYKLRVTHNWTRELDQCRLLWPAHRLRRIPDRGLPDGGD